MEGRKEKNEQEGKDLISRDSPVMKTDQPIQTLQLIVTQLPTRESGGLLRETGEGKIFGGGPGIQLLLHQLVLLSFGHSLTRCTLALSEDGRKSRRKMKRKE